MIHQQDNQIHISLFGVKKLINEHKEVESYTASCNTANLSSRVDMTYTSWIKCHYQAYDPNKMISK